MNWQRSKRTRNVSPRTKRFAEHAIASTSAQTWCCSSTCRIWGLGVFRAVQAADPDDPQNIDLKIVERVGKERPQSYTGICLTLRPDAISGRLYIPAEQLSFLVLGEKEMTDEEEP
jgi:hypothetical protein